MENVFFFLQLEKCPSTIKSGPQETKETLNSGLVVRMLVSADRMKLGSWHVVLFTILILLADWLVRVGSFALLPPAAAGRRRPVKKLSSTRRSWPLWLAAVLFLPGTLSHQV